MIDHKQYSKYIIGSKCSVPKCNNDAIYEVRLYDYYSYYGRTFYEQDFTCPFLCEEHMKLNEEKAVGERMARGYVRYPFSNQENAQGYSKYIPIKELYPELFSDIVIETNKTLQIDLQVINTELIYSLKNNPELIRKLDLRKFEELIAKIFQNNGYDVELTPQSRDGGKDIIATYKDVFGHLMFVIECKRYNEKKKVGIELVNRLYGVKTQGKYHKAIFITTSSFSKPAMEFVMPIKQELELKDFEDIQKWINNYKK